MPDDLAILIRNRRLELGLKARVVAKRLGIGHTTLWNWERGQDSRTGRPSRPRVEQLITLAKIYNLDIGPLLKLAGYSLQTSISMESHVANNANLVGLMSQTLKAIDSIVSDDALSEFNKQQLDEEIAKFVEWIHHRER